MHRYNMSQAKIAEVIDLNKSTVKRYLDEAIMPGGNALIKLSLFFGCSTDYLLGLTSERTPSKSNGKKDLSPDMKRAEHSIPLHKFTEEEFESLSHKQIEQIQVFVAFQIYKNKHV